jgi:hypothetical protein
MPCGKRRLPRECLRRLEDADLILHAGDVVGASVLEELERLAPVQAVAGNMDEPALLVALPERRVVEVDGARIGMVHTPGTAVGRGERLVAAFPAATPSSTGIRTWPTSLAWGRCGFSTRGVRPSVGARQSTRCSCWRWIRDRFVPKSPHFPLD